MWATRAPGSLAFFSPSRLKEGHHVLLAWLTVLRFPQRPCWMWERTSHLLPTGVLSSFCPHMIWRKCISTSTCLLHCPSVYQAPFALPGKRIVLLAAMGITQDPLSWILSSAFLAFFLHETWGVKLGGEVPTSLPVLHSPRQSSVSPLWKLPSQTSPPGTPTLLIRILLPRVSRAVGL